MTRRHEKSGNSEAPAFTCAIRIGAGWSAFVNAPPPGVIEEIAVGERIQINVEADLKPLMPRFLANRHKDLELIEQGLAAQNFERVRRTGHSMRGVGAGYGFERISELGKAIEEAAKRRDATQLLALTGEYRNFLFAVDVVYV